MSAVAASSFETHRFAMLPRMRFSILILRRREAPSRRIEATELEYCSLSPLFAGRGMRGN
jgi:hypothetical protein